MTVEHQEATPGMLEVVVALLETLAADIRPTKSEEECYHTYLEQGRVLGRHDAADLVDRRIRAIKKLIQTDAQEDTDGCYR